MKNSSNVLLFLGILLSLYSCSRENTVGTNQTGTGRDIPAVNILECHLQEYRRTYSTFGTVSYIKKAEVYPVFSELIREMPFEEGDTVAEGDLLVRLDDRKLKIRIMEARAAVRIKETEWNLAVQQLDEGRRNMEARFLNIENARLDRDRAEADFRRVGTIYENKKQLLDLEGVSREELAAVELEYFEKDLVYRQARSNLEVKKIGFREEDLVRAGYEIPQGEEEKQRLFIEYNSRMLQAEVEAAAAGLEEGERKLESLELTLADTLIKAPISGVVGRKYLEPGEMAAPEKPLYLIFPEDRVFASVEISEREMAEIHVGMSADVRTDLSEDSREGQVQRISPWIDQESRTGTVKILLKNQDSFFKVGQFVRINIHLSEIQKGILVPEESIVRDKEETYVFTLRGNRIFKTAVVCARPLETESPIVSGLYNGSLIIRDPEKNYRNGMEVSRL